MFELSGNNKEKVAKTETNERNKTIAMNIAAAHVTKVLRVAK